MIGLIVVPIERLKALMDRDTYTRGDSRGITCCGQYFVEMIHGRDDRRDRRSGCLGKEECRILENLCRNQQSVSVPVTIEDSKLTFKTLHSSVAISHSSLSIS